MRSAAPQDPREVDPGAVHPRVDHISRIDELTFRVVAPNPSPMTLDGTNTYVVCTPGSGEAIVIDPGPTDRVHLEAVESVLLDADAQCRAILVTHRHNDHLAAASRWADRWSCSVFRAQPEDPGELELLDAQRVAFGGAGELQVVATPGHTSDHLAFRSPTGALFTGDHVLGRGTTVVAHPDGQLGSYLSSLRRVLSLRSPLLFPGHGPHIDDDPSAVIEFYIRHRIYRLQQVTSKLAEGPLPLGMLVGRIYSDASAMSAKLRNAAELSTRAAVDFLAERGLVSARIIEGQTVIQRTDDATDPSWSRLLLDELLLSNM